MKKKTRGYLLMLVLGIGGLLFLAGIAAVSISSEDALQQRFLENTMEARGAADSGIAEAICALAKDPNSKADIASRYSDSGNYNLDFTQKTSLNNLMGTQAGQEDGHAVPVGCAYLVSKGQWQNCNVVSGAIISTGDFLFNDDFDSPAAGWVSNRPNLTVYLLGKWVLDLKLIAQTYLLKGDENWRNYTYEIKVLLTQASSLGFMVRASGDVNAPSGYVVGYSLLENPLRFGTFYLNRMENGKVVERLDQSYGSDHGLLGLAWLLNLQHTFKITVNEDQIKATVDGKEIIAATLVNPIKTGRVGIVPGIASLMFIDRANVRSLPEIRSRWRTL